MSRLSNLLREVEAKDPQLAADLRREVEALSRRRAFGLTFERHIPETVELPGRPIRRGDKVRFLPQRGDLPSSSDRRLWRVSAIRRTADGRVADLVETASAKALDGEEPETAERACEDLVVVAEFRDPIYPGLVSTGKVERGGDKPYHTVINAENYHALQALLYTHEGKVDAIYIDPPYNSGARDWKYNNDYVDSDDAYRHSKWLAMMERRLKLAKRLLNPDDSVLIVTIDEKEYLRLGLLLEQVFPGSKVQMVTSVINPKGTARYDEFSRVEEYVFFVMLGDVRIRRGLSDMLTDRDYASQVEVRWRGLARTGRKGLRANNPGSWYPIFVDQRTGQIHSIGDTVPIGEADDGVSSPAGTIAVWPPSKGRDQYSWGVVPETLRSIHARGGLKTGRVEVAKGRFPFYYLSSGAFRQIEAGDLVVRGRGPHGELIVEHAAGKKADPRSVWHQTAHDAGSHGTGMVQRLLPGRRFPFPKSLYAVEDALRFFVGDKPRAVIVDFFSGSGTTAHAVLRLNRQDGGRRQSISVTNNEVSADEEARLRRRGLRPGDPEWEGQGICEHFTKPRIAAAVTGLTPEGDPINGEYKFSDEFPMADGFEENVEFFSMTYEALRPVAHNRSFEVIAPLLWLRAGSEGRRIDKVADDFDVADTYGVLFDLDASHGFLSAVAEAESVRMAFIVTDDDRGFQMVCAELPAHVEPVRLYESYLTNFTINTSRD